MSSGGVHRGPPAHQNKFAFRHNKGSVKTQKILQSPISGLCHHCRDVVEWRKQFRKYKPLTMPKRCVGCELKTITMAYHVLCDKCASARRVCAKCMQSQEIAPATRRPKGEKEAEEEAEQQLLKEMSERQRRTYLRNKSLGRIKPGDPIPTRRSASGADDDFDDGFDDDDVDDDDDDDDDDDNGTTNTRKSSVPASGPSSGPSSGPPNGQQHTRDGDEDDDDEDEDEDEDEDDDDDN